MHPNFGDCPLTRSFLAIAAVAVAASTLLASGAQACISCEYVPEVVRSSSTLPHTGHYYAAERYTKKAGAASAKRRVVKSEPVARKLNIAKTEKAEKVAKAEKKSAPAEKVQKLAKADRVEVKSAESENSTITVATADAATKEVPVAKVEAAAKPTDCKKFFASVGMTLTVPCER